MSVGAGRCSVASSVNRTAVSLPSTHKRWAAHPGTDLLMLRPAHATALTTEILDMMESPE